MSFAAGDLPDIPPRYPLQRTDPRTYDLTVQLTIPWNQATPPTGGAGSPILWPILPRTNWSGMYLNAIEARLDNGPSTQIDKNAGHLAYQEVAGEQWLLRIPVPEKLQGRLQFRISFRTDTFSSALHENDAAKIAWPTKWADEFQPFLEPTDYIQSNNKRFARAVADVLGENPRSVSMHLAAKQLIRHCIQNITSDGRYTDLDSRSVRGFNVRGALAAASTGKGSASDLVCACVAILRSAGIPARPVVGMSIANTVGTTTVDPHYLVWAQYALPGAGWVPFNPDRMRGTIDGISLRKPWQGLGTMPWLNRRVPIAYDFVAGGKNKAYDAIGPWGWVPIYRNRQLPVPASQVKMPLYRSANEDVYILIQYLPSIQNLHMHFVGSPNIQ